MSWLPAVSGYNVNDSNNGYCGIIGKPISCIRINGGQCYRVHVKGGSWLPPVTGNNQNDGNNGYAGVIGREIDGVAIDGGVTYRVHLLGGNWLPAVNGYNTGDSNNGYAGVIGRTIDAVMIQGRNYAAYSEGGSGSVVSVAGGSSGLVNYGTGLPNIDYQKNIPHMKEGCCFMSSCVKGGLSTTAQILDAYSWGLNTGKIRSDTYIIVGREQFAKDISAKYGTTYHPDYIIKKNNRHFWIVNPNGKEIFNSAGLGWH